MRTVHVTGEYRPHLASHPDSASDSVGVAASNVPPEIVGLAIAPLEAERTEGSTLTFTATATDQGPLDNANLAYEWDFDGNGSYDLGPTSSNEEDHLYRDDSVGQVCFRVSDDDTSDGPDCWPLTILNVAPVVTSTDITSAAQDELYSYQLVVDDPGLDDDISFALSGPCADGSGTAPSGMSVTASGGLITWTPNKTQTDATHNVVVVVVVSDDDVSVCHSFSVIVPATCFDERNNQDETGVDCGGPNCGPCADGQGCDDDTDCISLVCTDNVCQVPACDDLVRLRWTRLPTLSGQRRLHRGRRL